jgi:hypothetical protein
MSLLPNLINTACRNGTRNVDAAFSAIILSFAQNRSGASNYDARILSGRIALLHFGSVSVGYDGRADEHSGEDDIHSGSSFLIMSCASGLGGTAGLTTRS